MRVLRATTLEWLPPKPVSNPAPPVVAPVVVTAPAVIGSAKRGSLLTTTDGVWSSYEAVSITYQWRRCDAMGNNAVDIGSATSSTYTTVSGDDDHTIVCKVTATNSAGSANSTSARTARIFPTFLVGVGGTSEPGVPDDLTVATGDPTYGSRAAAWRKNYEDWLGAPVNMIRQFAFSGTFGSSDVQWDTTQGSCIIKYALARLQKWQARTSPWTADAAGVVRKVAFVITPGFNWTVGQSPAPASSSDWWTSGNVPTSDAYNANSRLFAQQAWRWIAYGDKSATSQQDSSGSPTNQPFYCWTGTVDNYIDKMIAALNTYGLSNSVIMPWWESYGGNFTWQWVDPTAYIAAWRRVYTRARAKEDALGIAAGNRTIWAWPFFGTIPSSYTFFARHVDTGAIIQASECYPGDDYVDALQPDFYGQSFDSGAQTLGWMTEAKAFSDAHGGKLLINAEWGLKYSQNAVIAAPDTGTGSVQNWVTAAVNKMTTDKWYATSYFDTISPSPNGAAGIGRENFRLGPSTPPGIATSYPNSALTYQTLLGVPPSVGDPAAPVPSDGKTFVVYGFDSSAAPLKGFEKQHVRIQSNNTAGGTVRTGDSTKLTALGVNMERQFCRGNVWATSYNSSTHAFVYGGWTGNGRFDCLDDTMADAVTRSVEPVICIHHVPWQLGTGGFVDAVPTSAADHKTMIKAGIQHLKAQNAAWKVLEAWNEPDASSRENQPSGLSGGAAAGTHASGFSKAQAWAIYDTYSDAVTETNTEILAGTVSGVSTNAAPIQLVGPAIKAPDYQWIESFLTHVQGSSKKLDALTYHQYNGTELGGGDPGDFYTAAVNVNAMLTQAFSVAVDATGGTWTVTLLGQTSGAIAYNVTAAVLKSTLETLLGVTGLNVAMQQYSGGTTRYYHVTFPTVSQNINVGTVATSAASLTGASHTATVTNTAGFAGLFETLPVWVTEYDAEARNGTDGSTYDFNGDSTHKPWTGSTTGVYLTSAHLAEAATQWLANATALARGGVDKAFKFAQSDYQNYVRSVIVPVRLDSGQYDPAAAAGSVYPTYNVMRMMTMLPGSAVNSAGVGASVAALTDGHGFGCVAAMSTTAGVGSHGQVGIIVWYHRKAGAAQPNVTSPTIQVNNLPSGLRGRALVMHRYVVDKSTSNWEASQATSTLQQLADVTGLGPYTPSAHATSIATGVNWDTSTGEYKTALFIIEAATA